MCQTDTVLLLPVDADIKDDYAAEGVGGWVDE